MGLSKEAEPGSGYRRRLLWAALGAVLPCPIAWAQGRPGGPIVGFLMGNEAVQEILQPLRELGHVEGRNLRVEIRGAQSVRGFPNAAAQLVSLQPDVLVADGPAAVTLAAFTRTIPIVCAGIPDPVASGLAQSLVRPGGNVTGLATGSTDTAAIVFGLLKQMRPAVKRVVVVHSTGMPVETQMRAHGEAARVAGLEWVLAPIASTDDVERILPSHAGEAVWMAAFEGRRLGRFVLEVAHKHRMATIGEYHGALMWCGRTFSDPSRRVAAVIDRILKGANPAEIPFEVPDRQSFTLNRSTARAIGIEIPRDVLLRATEVID